MSVLENLQPASFKGFEFLVNSETSNSGKKIVSHEYPNNDKRFSEELGQIPPKFSLEIIVHGDINRRLRFEQLLRETGLGTLVHPVYGIVDVMSGAYSVTSNQNNIGEFRFSCNFETSEQNITPSETVADSFEVSSRANDTRSILNDKLEETYNVPSSSQSLDTVSDNVDFLLDTIQENLSKVGNVSEEGVSEFNSVASKIRNTIFTDAQSASSFSQTIKDVYDSVLNITAIPSDLLSVWLGLAVLDIPIITDNTVKRKEINENSLNFKNHTQITALAGAYESTSYVEFETEDDLLAAQDRLENLYNEIMLDSENSLAQDPDVRAEFSSMRNTARRVFDELAESVWRVVDIKTTLTSANLLSHRYYGSLENSEVLANLNKDQNSAYIQGDIKAVTR